MGKGLQAAGTACEKALRQPQGERLGGGEGAEAMRKAVPKRLIWRGGIDAKSYSGMMGYTGELWGTRGNSVPRITTDQRG